MARRSEATIAPTTHTVVAKPTLTLVNGRYVEGLCVDDIEYYLGGQAFLRSGQIFVIRDDGSVKLYPRQGLRGENDVAIEKLSSLPGYRKVMARQVRVWPTSAGKRESYIGLFKGKPDNVIAKFDMLNGNPLGQADILIRSQAPITSVDYLPAPDAPQGQIGFVQPVGTDKAWLYTYEWRHGITGRTAATTGATTRMGSRREGEQNANDIARAIAKSGGLEILPDPPHGYSTPEPLIFRTPGEPARPRPHRPACKADPNLAAHPAKMSLTELRLENVQPSGLTLETGRLDAPKVTILTGRSASLVQDSSVGIIGLTNGEFFAITPCIEPYANEGRQPFRKAELERAQIPDLPNAEFLHADRIGSARTAAGLSTHYIGLWKQRGNWLIADFTVPTEGARSNPARPLMRSSLPIRSINYFPAPDTPSGSVTLVQEAGQAIRIIKFDWWHAEKV